jgi:hypothetical protein
MAMAMAMAMATKLRILDDFPCLACTADQRCESGLSLAAIKMIWTDSRGSHKLLSFGIVQDA